MKTQILKKLYLSFSVALVISTTFFVGKSSFKEAITQNNYYKNAQESIKTESDWVDDPTFNPDTYLSKKNEKEIVKQIEKTGKTYNINQLSDEELGKIIVLKDDKVCLNYNGTINRKPNQYSNCHPAKSFSKVNYLVPLGKTILTFVLISLLLISIFHWIKWVFKKEPTA